MRTFLLACLALLCCFALLAVRASDEGSCGADPSDAAGVEDTGMCTAPPSVTEHAATPSHSAPATSSPAAAAGKKQSMLERIQARGTLICAHCDDTLGHSLVVSNSSASGMEPELCIGLAAALGVMPSFWLMRTPAERFPLLQSGEVDIAFALTSKTIQRDMMEQGAFSVPYFQDQHNLMVRSDAGISSAADLSGKTICVTAGTTNPNVFGDYLRAVASELKGGIASVKIETVADDSKALKLMAENKCHGFVNDHSVVAGYVWREAAPAEGVTYVLADWEGTPFARAPFSAVTLEGDNEFASVVDWFVQGLFLAEMYGVTQENAQDVAEDPSLPGEAQRLLGAQLVGGQRLPFDMLAAVLSIGNYAEVYERNFGAFLPRTKANQLYQNGGAIFPGGFR